MAGTAAQMLNSTFSYYGFSTFFPSIEQEFHWSRATISGAFSLSRVESGLLGPIEGYLTERLGVRRMMIIGLVVLSLGFLLLSRVNSVVAFYLVTIFGIVLGGSLGFHMPISYAVANWFRRKRGKAFGIIRSGPGLAGFLVPLVGMLIVAVGWRTAAVVAGLGLLVVGFPLALVMRSRPEDCGLVPDGVAPGKETNGSGATLPAAAQSERVETGTDFTARQALGTPAFWLMSFCMLFANLVTSGVLIHFVVMLQDRGVPVAAGSTLLGMVALVSVPGRLGFAWLSDYVSGRRLLVGLMAVLGVVVFLMASAASLPLFAGLTVIFALAYGGSVSVVDPLRARYFGVRHFATIMGWMRLLQAAGHFSGPLLAGFIYDRTGNYGLAFTIFAVAAFGGALCMVAARKPSLRTAQARP